MCSSDLPEHIAARNSVTEVPADRTVEAMVEVVQHFGLETVLHLTASGNPLVARVAGHVPARVKQRISVAFDLRQACFFDGDIGQAL